MSGTSTRSAEQRIEEIRPVTDIHEVDGGAVLRLELPGAVPGTISVKIEDDVLSVTAQRPEFFPGHRLLSRETGRGTYRCSFRLSRDLSREGMKADYNLGVLTVTIPRAEHTIPRRIEVKTAD